MSVSSRTRASCDSSPICDVNGLASCRISTRSSPYTIPSTTVLTNRRSFILRCRCVQTVSSSFVLLSRLWYDSFLLVILPPRQTGRRRESRCSLPVRSFVCYQTCEHDILKTTELHDFDANRQSSPQCKGMKRSVLRARRSRVKGQDHTKPEVDCEACWGRHSRPHWVKERFSQTLLRYVRLMA